MKEGIDIAQKVIEKVGKGNKEKFLFVSRFIEGCIAECNAIITIADVSSDQAKAIHIRLKNLYAGASNVIGEIVVDPLDLNRIVKAIGQGRIYYRARQVDTLPDEDLYAMIEERHNQIRTHGNAKIWQSSYECVLQKLVDKNRGKVLLVKDEINQIKDMAIAEMEILKELKTKYDKLASTQVM